MFPHAITIWNRSDDEKYTRVVVNGLWEDNRGAQLRKTGVSSDNGIFVMIPMQGAPEGFSVRAGDFMAQGDIDLAPRSARELAGVAVLVSAVDRFDFGGLPHWEVTGK